MAAIRLVSMSDPLLADGLGRGRLEALSEVETTLISSAAGPELSAARRMVIPLRGNGRGATMPTLGSALELIDPHVVHLHGEPDTALAVQTSKLCHRFGIGLLLETDLAGLDTVTVTGWARQTLSAVDAVLCRSAQALSALRRLGFRGAGTVAAGESQAGVLPARDEARHMLHLPLDHRPVVGWIATTARAGRAQDLLEALAICDGACLAVIDAGARTGDVVDQADALEVLPALRTIGDGPEQRAALFGAIDALIVAHPETATDRRIARRQVELALAHGVPVIHPPRPDLVELVGAAGWSVPDGDPVLLARLLAELSARPAHLADAAAAAAAVARSNSPAAAAEQFARAVHEAATLRPAEPVKGRAAAAARLWLTALARRS